MSSTESAADVRTPAKAGRPGHDQHSVLTIAVGVFNEFGYEATSMGVLAERLGTSKSAIYHHFPGKEDVLRRALDYALGGLEAILEDARATAGPADVRLRFVVAEAVRVLCERLPYVTLLLRLRGNTEVERDALDRRRRFNAAMAALVEAARADGTVRTDVDARTTTRLLFGMINSIVEWYRPGGPMTPALLAQDVLAVAFDGIRAP
ncbi:TetR/AcrR family transcriptional regulator [Glaciibacter superstes]|uniref:TetR/AcrR family transcriptional regulator n=1 Tax=Glaciibacter superstes TaxID=501023 RepID=UPI0003B3C2A2|nr:TetR/AcrR family transcriptional regulator [Glaciibacter superstes]